MRGPSVKLEYQDHKRSVDPEVGYRVRGGQVPSRIMAVDDFEGDRSPVDVRYQSFRARRGRSDVFV